VLGHVSSNTVVAVANPTERGDLLTLGGSFGVYLFFALSAYLLYLPFARHAFAGGRRIDLRRYASNRALRILPLYYVVLVAYLAIWRGGGTLEQWLLFATFSENFSTETLLTVNPVMWSLVVELHFYVALPLIAWIVARLARGSSGVALAIVLAVGLASFAARWATLYEDVTPNQYLRYSLPSCFMFFAPGMLLALLRLRWEQATPRWLAGPLRMPELWLLAAVALWWKVSVGVAIGYLMAPASFLMLGACVLPLRSSPVLAVLSWRPLAFVGVVSYSVYLWHVVVVHELKGRFDLTGQAELLAVAVPVVVAVSAVSYLLVERPFLRLRRRWGSTPAASESAPGVPTAAPAAHVGA
jgi:peptidoglycan/LPS O-acetylase OafA/YrhL